MLKHSELNPGPDVIPFCCLAVLGFMYWVFSHLQPLKVSLGDYKHAEALIINTYAAHAQCTLLYKRERGKKKSLKQMEGLHFQSGEPQRV